MNKYIGIGILGLSITSFYSMILACLLHDNYVLPNWVLISIFITFILSIVSAIIGLRQRK